MADAKAPQATSNDEVLPPPGGTSNEELVRWAFERINARDEASLRPAWHDTVEYMPQGVCRGPDEIAAYFRQAWNAMPDDFNLAIVGLAASGDDVFVRWKLTGTFTGENFEGIEATGSSIELDGIDHFVIRDGRIVTNNVVFDQMSFARQLGMMPADGSAGDRAMKALFNGKTRLAGKLRR